MTALAQHLSPVRTTCPYCGVGCGIVATPDGNGGAAIAGDPDHPANFGQLCSKGSALGETLALDTRLLQPMMRDADGALAHTDWELALQGVAGGFQETIRKHGPDSVAFYLSGQLLTEDYYVANKLMKGFIGSANVDTNSRLCMASSVAGHKRAFGSDTVPGNYEDLDQADLIILVGSNTAWCHPILFRRIMRNREQRGAKVVVIDPRRTSTADEADLFLPIAPGTDTVLFSALLVHLAESGGLARAFIDTHTADFDASLMRAREIAPDLATVAQTTGLPDSDIAQLLAWFRATPRTVTCFSQGVNQSAQGTDKVNAIINCHLATGRIGKPGQGPLSLTGQPNAMGGREVGGLANQLAAHMGFSPPEVDRVRRFWDAPAMAQREGLKAVDMFDAIARGEIKALWVMATNPAVSMPRADAVSDALRKLDLLVVSDNVRSTDTIAAGAHILLPAAAWGEKSGTVTNSERRISRQRTFLAAAGESKPDWWIVTEVARRMGFVEAFRYESAADIFREHAALSAFENDGTRDFNLGALADISSTDYAVLQPTQWGDARFFGDGGFFTPSRRAKFIAPEQPRPRATLQPAFPLRLITGRMRDQWHTMTRSGMSPRLADHSVAPSLEIHPHDAAVSGLKDGGFAHVASAHGACILRVRVSDALRRGTVFAPIHWSNTTSSSARIGALVHAGTDPFSGQPELKATPVAVKPVTFTYQGFVLSRDGVTLPADAWWVRVAVKGGVGYLIASDLALTAWRDWARGQGEIGISEYFDDAGGVYRAARAGDVLDMCVFIGSTDAAPRWDAMKALLASDELPRRAALLSGRGMDGGADAGPLICACFGVGLATLREAIAKRAAVSVEDIGRLLKAGTNCGSCLPELKRIVRHEHAPNSP